MAHSYLQQAVEDEAEWPEERYLRLKVSFRFEFNAIRRMEGGALYSTGSKDDEL